MTRELAISISILVLSSLSFNAAGQDTLRVRTDLQIKRAADSLQAAAWLRSAERYSSEGRIDSAQIYLSKSLQKSRDADFLNIEAACYELLASVYDSLTDWEETLRNYLSASAAYTKMGDKTNQARLLKIIAEKYFGAGVYRKSAQYSEQEFLLYDEKDNLNHAMAAEMAGRSYYYIPVDSLSSKWYNAASFYYERAGDHTGQLRCIEKLGILLSKLGRYDDALEKYYKVLSVYSSANDYKKVAEISNQIGYLMFRKGDLNAALMNFTLAVQASEKAGKDDSFLTDVWSNIAVCHQNLGNQKEMLQGFQKALQYARDSGRKGEAARIDRILSTIYYRKGDNYHAELYCLDCIESARESGNLDLLQLCYKDYSAILERGNDFVKALDLYEKHLSLRDSLNYAEILARNETADMIAEYESAEQRLRDQLASEEIQGLQLKNLRADSSRKANELALLLKQQALDRSKKDSLAQSLVLEKERFELSRRLQDIRSLRQQQKYDSISIKQQKAEAEALTNRNQLLENEKAQAQLQARKEKQIRQLTVGIGILMVLVAITILGGLISTRRQNQRLAESKRQIEKINADLERTNAEVLKQKDIIEQKNQSITDSILYASRIQTAVLPPVTFLSDWGIDNFILYKPKAIVSGDFYWGVKKNGKIIVAAGDCTGHGVPGAFMSMLGHAFLDEIINTKELADAATILNHLRDEIINTLKQKGTTGETRDGMDISLVILDRKAGKLDYAGANNPLYIIRDGKMQKYQADRMPIGIHFISFTPFTNQVVEIKKDDFLYIFSDGYADQFGGPKGRKFMYKPFQDLLLHVHYKPMEIQKTILDNTFEKWKGEHEQVDDVLVIGMHI